MRLPTTFLPGMRAHVFATPLIADEAAWTLDGHRAIARRRGPRCDRRLEAIPSQDTFIDRAEPDRNHGSSAVLRTDAERKIVIQFDRADPTYTSTRPDLGHLG